MRPCLPLCLNYSNANNCSVIDSYLCFVDRCKFYLVKCKPHQQGCLLDLDSKLSIDFPLTMELQVPVDVETIFAKVKKKHVKKALRGSESLLYKATWPMIYIVRVFGLAPYSFSRNRFVLSNVNLIFTTIAAILYSYILYDVFNRMLNGKRETWTGTEMTKVSKILVETEQKITRDTTHHQK